MIERSDDHRYRRGGSPWVPGVTSITGMMPKGGLVPWAANAVARAAVDAARTWQGDADEEHLESLYHDLRAEPDRVREKASSLGTRVHDYAEHKLAGQDPIFADDVEPYAAQYIEGFIERYSPTPIAREFYVWGGDYGGTADLYCDIDGSRWLIDYKTSTKPIVRSGFPYADTALQLAGLGYADLWQVDGEEDRTAPIDHYGVLAITPTDCRLIEYDVTEREWETFRALLTVKTWTTERKGRIKP